MSLKKGGGRRGEVRGWEGERPTPRPPPLLSVKCIINDSLLEFS